MRESIPHLSLSLNRLPASHHPPSANDPSSAFLEWLPYLPTPPALPITVTHVCTAFFPFCVVSLLSVLFFVLPEIASPAPSTVDSIFALPLCSDVCTARRHCTSSSISPPSRRLHNVGITRVHLRRCLSQRTTDGSRRVPDSVPHIHPRPRWTALSDPNSALATSQTRRDPVRASSPAFLVTILRCTEHDVFQIARCARAASPRPAAIGSVSLSVTLIIYVPGAHPNSTQRSPQTWSDVMRAQRGGLSTQVRRKPRKPCSPQIIPRCTGSPTASA
ncbi:hypothetical protein DAEQUDRAFT_468935 [Daedalea quercina L-15889]|uniref:Uncharacterized protein n=1 Tax=Daedalea quercina L-15889 TaxID=1314783 RepID=A0A165TGL8_9APHY|nr:hypothetical protein DAEQUDRAFT_468935 [Daedalea quercina L-15889]